MVSARRTTTRTIVPRGFSGSPINRIKSSSPTARIGYTPMQTSFARESIKQTKGRRFEEERREKRIEIASTKSALEAVRAATANGESLTREQVKRIVLKNVPKDQRGKILNKVQAIDRNQRSGKFKLYGVTYGQGKEKKAEAAIISKTGGSPKDTFNKYLYGDVSTGKVGSGAELRARNSKLYKISPKAYRLYSAFQKKTRKYDPVSSAYSIGFRAVEGSKTKGGKRTAVGTPVGLLPMPNAKNRTYYSKTVEPSQAYSFAVPRTSGEVAIDLALSYGATQTLRGLRYARRVSPKVLRFVDKGVARFVNSFETKYVLSGFPIPKSQRRLSKAAIRKKNIGQFSMPKKGTPKFYVSKDTQGNSEVMKVTKFNKNFKVTEVLSTSKDIPVRGIQNVNLGNSKALVAYRGVTRKPRVQVIEERKVPNSTNKALLSYYRGEKGSAVLTIVKKNNKPIVFKDKRQVQRVVNSISGKGGDLSLVLKKASVSTRSKPLSLSQSRPKMKQFSNPRMIIEMDTSGRISTINGLKPQTYNRIVKAIRKQSQVKPQAGFRQGMKEKLFSKLRQKQKEIYSKRELQLWKGSMPPSKYGQEMSKELLKKPTLVLIDEGTGSNKRFLVARNQKILSEGSRGGKIINAKYRIIKIKSPQKFKPKTMSKFKSKSKIRAKQKSNITNKQIIRRALGSNVAIKQFSAQAQKRVQRTAQTQAQAQAQAVAQRFRFKTLQTQAARNRTRKPVRTKTPQRRIKQPTRNKAPSRRGKIIQRPKPEIKKPKKDNPKIPIKTIQQKKLKRRTPNRKGKYYNERTYKYVKL